MLEIGRKGDGRGGKGFDVRSNGFIFSFTILHRLALGLLWNFSPNSYHCGAKAKWVGD